MTQIRRYRVSEMDILLEHIEKHLQKTRLKRIVFAPKKIRDTLVGNERNSQFFCNVAVDEKDQPIAGLCASAHSYMFSYDAIAFDHFFYIQSDKRSMVIATALVESYVAWAKERKVKEVLLQNFAGLNTEAFKKLAERLGFKAIGSFHSMEL